MKLFIVSLTLTLHHEVISQLIRALPLGFEQTLTEVIEPRQFMQQLDQLQQFQLEQSPQYLQTIEPYNTVIPSKPMANVPTDFPIAATTIPNFSTDVLNSFNSPNFPTNSLNTPLALISDCSPLVCNNLANTIQLLTISSLLQNKDGGDEVALRLAAPILKNILSGLPVGTSRSIKEAPKIISPKFVRSNLIKASPSIASLPIPSRIIVSAPIIPNNVLSSASNNGQIDRGLLSKILKLLGSLQ